MERCWHQTLSKPDLRFCKYWPQGPSCPKMVKFDLKFSKFGLACPIFLILISLVFELPVWVVGEQHPCAYALYLNLNHESCCCILRNRATATHLRKERKSLLLDFVASAKLGKHTRATTFFQYQLGIQAPHFYPTNKSTIQFKCYKLK